MIGQARKLLSRIVQVWRLCGPGTGIRYTAAVLMHLPLILKRRNLQPADAAMTGSVTLNFRGRPVVVPFTDADRANVIANDGPTFAGIREILGDEVYLRGFRRLGDLKTFVDLGANRGMVSLMAAAGLGVPKVVAVEAQPEYSPCFEVLADANGLSEDQRHRVVKFAGAADDDTTISIDGLCRQFGIDRIDFLKCDIEGGENAVVLGGAPPFWDRVGLVAMELHPEAGTRTDEIVASLIDGGFNVSVTDPDGNPSELMRATYLFAAREARDLAYPISVRSCQ